MAASHDDLLREQMTYYQARAGEYDEWFLRQGRYDHGAEENARWREEVAEVVTALDETLEIARSRPGVAALELAAGTGLWTQRLVQRLPNATVTAVDAAAEALALNRERLGAASARVDYQVADLFTWEPRRRYDLVFFSFWLSHVPPERFATFWALVRDCLAPEGRVFLVDSRYTPSSSARDHQLEGADATQVTRRLNDGRTYRIVKVFYTPERLRDKLGALGWRADIRATPTYFLYGPVTLATPSG
ncbi:MAG TPA: class I SAM-dependent methyltransferase [Ktedonobacterales bacterium]|jgi:demethylmenaquinone methyltransferase/2-methoxy-6-polyprenyl-1,4-benzoquinol methylase|nr:class I SAM-dependent methyltransferase [Ktedonobacterales bacterium]